ncbi:terpene synthase [Auriculariales sp. MPI-PUGE-AT-0066]|nr:terpene synthase [Auriculariales sp. MPI-PUGE-AT-0066]
MSTTKLVGKDVSQPFTDYSRWRLRAADDGRHTWHYLKTDKELEQWPLTEVDKYWLGLRMDAPTSPPATNGLEAARKGFSFLKRLQAPGGHWPGEYGGPMFLLPGFVIGSYVSGMPIPEEERLEIIRYICNLAHPEDGGWGLHIESPSTAFGTACNYCVLRILGVGPDEPVTQRARATLHKLGGATGVPSWGKFWLSILNVYEWDGTNAIPPELWLLPEWLPIHPHRWWIHTRNIYIPMSYLYGCQFQGEETKLVLQLREELYTQKYNTIDWPAQRNNVCSVDVYSPHTMILDALFSVIGMYSSCAPGPIRKAGMQRAYELVCMEDENTAYQDLAPVSKMMNLVVRFVADGPGSEAYKRHMETRADFMWLGPEGMRMCGTNGSQLWDLAFIGQALVETGLGEEPENRDSLLRALQWLDRGQMRADPVHCATAYRQPTKGAWGFSTREQGYIVSDCTGEGLKTAIYIQTFVPGAPKLIDERRMCDAVDRMLQMQNPNGGFASYELVRAPHLLELINPAEVFGNIMTDYCYAECTTSVITALALFRKHVSNYRAHDIERTIQKAKEYLYDVQCPEGGFYGSWGICFTYATMFALESLTLVGETYDNSERVRRACTFLVKHQMADGGWGESYKSCEEHQYVNHEKSQVVQTSWAVLALMYGKYPERGPIERGVKLVMSRQLPNGSWAQEAIEGIFNKTCAISYPLFKFSFTIWMLGKAHKYLQALDVKGVKA